MADEQQLAHAIDALTGNGDLPARAYRRAVTSRADGSRSGQQGLARLARRAAPGHSATTLGGRARQRPPRLQRDLRSGLHRRVGRGPSGRCRTRSWPRMARRRSKPWCASRRVIPTQTFGRQRFGALGRLRSWPRSARSTITGPTVSARCCSGSWRTKPPRSASDARHCRRSVTCPMTPSTDASRPASTTTTTNLGDPGHGAHGEPGLDRHPAPGGRAPRPDHAAGRGVRLRRYRGRARRRGVVEPGRRRGACACGRRRSGR